MFSSKVTKLLSVVILIVLLTTCGKAPQKSVNLSSNLDKNSNRNSLAPQQLIKKAFPAFPEELNINRSVSIAAEAPIRGIDWVFSKGDLNHVDFANPDAYSIISDDKNRIAYVQYATEVFVNRPVKLNIKAVATKVDKSDPKTVDFEYHLALANFTKRSWDWFGPFTGDQSIEINSVKIRERYLSPTSRLHYVVVVAQNTAGQTVGASIVSTQSDSSPTAYATLPLFASVNIIHVGTNIDDLSVKRVSALDPNQELRLVWPHKEVSIAEDSATEYEVYANAVGEKTPYLIGTIASPKKDGLVVFKVPTDVIPEKQANFTVGNTYQFYVKSKNQQGSAPRSWSTSAQIPTILPPTNVAASTNQPDGVKITWTKAVGATGYKIYRDKQDKSIVTLGDIDNYLDTSVQMGKEYKYWVVSLKNSEVSGFSIGTTGKAISLDQQLGVPQNVTATTDLVGRILITWDPVEGAEAYHIVRDEVDENWGSMNTQYLDLTVTDPVLHEYKVRALSRTRPNSEFSAPVKGKINGLGGSLPPVNNLTCTYLNPNGVEIKWDATPGAKKYLLSAGYYKYDMQIDQNLTSTFYTDKMAITGKNIVYWVCALNDTEKSTFSYNMFGAKNTPLDDYEPDNSIEQSIPIKVTDRESSIYRTISSPSDEDWFSFNAKAFETYNFYTLSSTPLTILLYTPSKEFIDIDFSYQGPENNSFIQYKAQVDGTYYLRVGSIQSALADYYLVYQQGACALFPPDFIASTNRVDDILLSIDTIPGVDGYRIYRDKLDTPIAEVPNTNTDFIDYLDKVSDYNPHHYWIKSFYKSNESQVGQYKVGQVVAPDSYEPDNLGTQAKVLVPTSSIKSQERSIAPNGDLDYLILNGVKDVTYHFWSVSSLDTYITVYDNAMKKITYDDDSGPNTNFFLSFTPTSTSLYYLEIKSYYQESAGQYVFYYTTGNPNVNNISLTATYYSDQGIYLNWDHKPWIDGYRIYRDSLDNKIIEVGKVNTYLDDTISDMQPHTYWIQPFNATHEYPLSNFAVGYRLSKDMFEDNDTLVNSKKIIIGNTVDNYDLSIYPAGEADWFRFLATENTMYYFILKKYNSRPYMYLYDNTSTLIKFFNNAKNSWVAPKTGTYYLKVEHDNKTFQGVYSLYCYACSDTFPYPPPQNVKASTDNPDFIHLSWDPVPNCNYYYVYINNTNGFYTGTEYNSINIPNMPENTEFTFYISASYEDPLDYGSYTGIESLPSNPVKGKTTQILSDQWLNYNLFAQTSPAVFVPVTLTSGKPALVFNSMSSSFTYAYATVANPTSMLDWSDYMISAKTYDAVDMSLIDKKPACSFKESNKLSYVYSSKETPTDKTDWTSLTLFEPTDGYYTKVAEVDKKPAIVYSRFADLKFIQSKTNPPADGTPGSWETPVTLSTAYVSKTFDLVVDPKTGFPAIVFDSLDRQICFAYANKLVPSVIGDWTVLVLDYYGDNPSLAYVNGYPLIAYVNKQYKICLLSTNTNKPTKSDWSYYEMFNIGFNNAKVNLYKLSDGTPALTFSDFLSYTRLATTKTLTPKNQYDWNLYQIDTAASSNQLIYLLENTKLSVLYATNSNLTIHYATLK